MKYSCGLEEAGPERASSISAGCSSANKKMTQQDQALKGRNPHIYNFTYSAITSLVLLWLLVACATASKTAAPKQIDLFLLIGQSNMAGRGPLDAAPKSPNPGIWVINSENQWVIAKDPLHFDKPTVVGVGPGLAFAERWLELNPKARIGLVPCAVGGSSIDDWQPGQKHAQTGIYAYDAMLQRVRLAQQKGKIKAILWHQGESDSNPTSNKVHEEKLDEFFARLRRDLDARDTPIILGTLGDFIVKKNPDALPINQIISSFPQNHPNVYSVSSAGLTHKGDVTHFDTPSARELGKRYAEKLWIVTKK